MSSEELVTACRDIGVPIVFVFATTDLEFWKQTQRAPELLEVISRAKLSAFFKKHEQDFSPDAVFRAKTWGRFDRHYQLSFVDYGLMSLVEREIGTHLGNLVERVIKDLRLKIWPRKDDLSFAQGRWLFKSAFWLLAAKILQDKGVRGFKFLAVGDLGDILRRVARHYDTQGGGQGPIARNAREKDALNDAADTIFQFAHLAHVTTESLGYVYENTLIDKQTRAALGTHSTPPYLVDYMVAKLIPWIEEIPVRERDVFEPACGHAVFLVSAMRALKELLPPELKSEREGYLRARLHGCEMDAFALEIARLSLTLADIPNPNGWDLERVDMFADDILTRKASKATILLANAPFTNFSTAERAKYKRKGFPSEYLNKTAEVLGRTLPHLRAGAVFGVVVPQGLLHTKNAANIRRLMTEQFEIAEICLFPDKLFAFSDAESAIILGRRLVRAKKRVAVSYRRVREKDRDRFKRDYEVTTKRNVPQAQFAKGVNWSMRFPDLPEVWEQLSANPKFVSIAIIGRGFDFEGGELPPEEDREKVFPRGSRKGIAAFVNWRSRPNIHELPTEVHINPKKVKTKRMGLEIEHPQILANEACAGRGPWRIKALVDRVGHAFAGTFLVIRPRSEECMLEYLWALLNSPLANAYVYAHSMKWHISQDLVNHFPIPCPSFVDVERIAEAAKAYLQSLTESQGSLFDRPVAEDRARKLLMRLDAEVLRLYDLPPRLERQVLDLFSGEQRVGVPFTFERYFPEDFEPWLSLHEYLSEEYERSTAEQLRAVHQDVTSPRLVEALRLAIVDLEE